MKLFIKIFLPLCAVILVVILFLAAFNNGLTVREYKISSDKISETVRIVHISDLHSYIFGEDQSELIEQIKSLSPDLVLYTGDIADDVTPDGGTTLLLDGLAGLFPSYYVTGNHEVWSDALEDKIELFRSRGVRVLRGETDEIEINGTALRICGIDDPTVTRYGKTSYWDKIEDVFSNLSDDRYNILLSHRPELFDVFESYNFDLVLSGHAHGGQVRVPLVLNGLFAPNQGFFPEYAGGRYRMPGYDLVVSRGLVIDNKPRIFNPPELPVIELVNY